MRYGRFPHATCRLGRLIAQNSTKPFMALRACEIQLTALQNHSSFMHISFHAPISTIDLPYQIWRLSHHPIALSPWTLHCRFVSWSDSCRFTRSPPGLVNLHHSSVNCLRDIIPVIHPVIPPCPPIYLRTLLLSNLNRSFTLHSPYPMVLMHFCSLTPSFAILTFDCSSTSTHT